MLTSLIIKSSFLCISVLTMGVYRIDKPDNDGKVRSIKKPVKDGYLQFNHIVKKQ